MRLINTETLKLEEFYGDGIPEYAILSHTWEGGEVTFQDWQNLQTASKKAGFTKIAEACQKASKHGLSYLWVDTNCIDKSSSAELTEAINSMFAWYQNSAVCYAYLSDVSISGATRADELKQIGNSRWFTRGWTLQELLAPRRVVFYSRHWERLGEVSSGFAKEISKITGIEVGYLTRELPLELASVAKKMYWVSRRTTTRVEDMAYCMLGIFDINMPLLYGEGTKAFVRLQEEIIKVSNDHTIFCWTWNSSVPRDWVSILAPSPKTFVFSGDMVACTNLVGRISTYSMTNAGLSIRLPLIQTWSFYLGVLNAQYEGAGRHQRACIPLGGFLDKPASQDNRLFRRLPFPAGLSFLSQNWTITEEDLFVRSRSVPLGLTPIGQKYSFTYGILLTVGGTELLLDNRIHSLSQFESGKGVFLVEKTKDLIGLETYPTGLFDRDRSLFLFDHHLDGSVKAGLLRLGQFQTGLVIFFAIKVSPKTGVLWFCQILPASYWGSHQSQRERTVEKLRNQAALRNKDQRYHVAAAPYTSVIIGDEIVRSGHIIRVAYISCDSWRRRDVFDFISDNAMDEEDDSDSNSIVPALAHLPASSKQEREFDI
jgi:hypothetical protein